MKAYITYETVVEIDIDDIKEQMPDNFNEWIDPDDIWEILEDNGKFDWDNGERIQYIQIETDNDLYDFCID